MKSTILAAGAAVALSLAAGQAGAGTYSVAGTSNPFLAGMPAGSPCCSGDSAPAESPVDAGGVTAGDSYMFTSVTGSVSYAGGTPTDPPTGDTGYLIDTAAYEGGLTSIDNIAGYNNAPVDALVGVFLGAGLPTSNPAPAELDFSSPTLTPLLQQVFYIGDGTLGLGTAQAFIAPAGATRLFLGTVDGFGWYNNTGAISVTVNTTPVPEPASWAMMILGFLGLGLVLRRRNAALAA